MPVFLERLILPVLAAVLIIFGVTNPLALGWQVRVVLSLIALALAYRAALWVHRYNQRKPAAALDAGARSLLVPGTGQRQLAAQVFTYGDGPPITLPDGRLLIRQSPEYLLGLCRDLMQIQIDRITAPYIGKWMRFTGRVHNVVSLRQSTMLFLKLGNNIATYAMEFETAAWADHLSLLAKGSDVAVLGKIAKIGSIELFLIDCELVETE